eukprot:NODE_30_length_32972_cov_0.541052.p23 type:complete len:101 gc:universal NODE_30_length_32972_cov_0.541052:802-1104(+)
MAGQYYNSPLLKLLNKLPYVSSVNRIHSCSGFIQNYYLRIPNGCNHHAQSSFHSSTIGPSKLVLDIPQSYGLKSVLAYTSHLCFRYILKFCIQFYMLHCC